MGLAGTEGAAGVLAVGYEAEASGADDQKAGQKMGMYLPRRR